MTHHLPFQARRFPVVARRFPALASRLLVLLTVSLVCVIAASAQTREEYSYDDMGRVSRYRVVNGGQALVVSYEYDKRNNITRTFTEIVSSVDANERIFTIAVKPNPTSSEITIEAPYIPGSVVLFSITTKDGRQVMSENVTVDDTGLARLFIDTAKRGLASGSYNVTMNNGAMSSSASFVVAK